MKIVYVSNHRILMGACCVKKSYSTCSDIQMQRSFAALETCSSTARDVRACEHGDLGESIKTNL